MNKHFTSNRLTLAALALATAAATGSVHAADATASAASTVVAPIEIDAAVNLSFGTVTRNATGGTVTLSPDNTYTPSGVSVVGGTPTAARFDVTGETGKAYTISFEVAPLKRTGGTEEMSFTTISDTTQSAKTSGDVSVGSLTTGAQSIYVGGVLTVAANQAAGEYVGSVKATVEYQ